MPNELNEDLQEGQQTEQEEAQSFEDAALENMEDTLRDMHGGELNDDDESSFDEPTDDEEKDKNEEEKGQQKPAPADGEDAPEEAGAPGEEGDKDGPVDYDPAEDDKLAASMNEKTRERFEHFRNENKDLGGHVEQLTGQYNELLESTQVMNGYIQDSQISPEQLSTALALAKAINTGDFEMARGAMPRMQQMMNHIAVGLGDTRSAQVQLPEDLERQVNNLDITPEAAQELAVLRAQGGLKQQYRGAQQQQQQAQGQAQQMAQGAANDIKTWEAEMVRSDPDFAAKRTKMLARSKAFMEKSHPSEWLPRLQEQYDLISETMTDFAEREQRQAAKAQGIRPGQQAGGVSQEPAKTLEEHMDREYKRMEKRRA